MDQFAARYAPHAHALLRIVAGAMFAMHGTQKLFGFPYGPPTGDTLLIVAGLIETGGGVLITIGFLTRWGALLGSGTMAFAYFLKHASAGFWPLANKGELAVLYCFVFLYIAARGAGIWSVDGETERAGS